jgi:hypothetical protein
MKGKEIMMHARDPLRPVANRWLAVQVIKDQICTNREAAVRFSHVVNQLHNQHRLAHARTAEQADLTT